jgi:hypothetical protein
MTKEQIRQQDIFEIANCDAVDEAKIKAAVVLGCDAKHVTVATFLYEKTTYFAFGLYRDVIGMPILTALNVGEKLAAGSIPVMVGVFRVDHITFLGTCVAAPGPCSEAKLEDLANRVKEIESRACECATGPVYVRLTPQEMERRDRFREAREWGVDYGGGELSE